MGFGIEEEKLPTDFHGFTQIEEGWDWVKCYGLCFFAIKPSCYQAIKLSSHKRKSAVPAD
jgi:hypothetical protein